MTAPVKACSKVGLIQLSPRGPTLRQGDSLVQKTKKPLKEIKWVVTFVRMKYLMTE